MVRIMRRLDETRREKKKQKQKKTNADDALTYVASHEEKQNSSVI